jgi:DNA invertase Pin-like site-specific DNA recombinase
MASNKDTVMDGYVRISRVQGREGEGYISPKVQREAIQRWADYKGITIGEWLVDEDQSGGTQDRPQLKIGIERALAGHTAGLVSWKIDRFSRNSEGGLRDLRRLQAANARLAFVVEDVDTATVYGRMVYTILLAVSEAFLENVKAGWVEAKTRAVTRGVPISRTPFGYQRRDDGTIEPDPATGPVVAEAFKVAAAQGLAAAMDYLIEAWPQRRWNTTKVRRLLSGRVYLGLTAWGDVEQAGTHTELVSRRTWEAAQTLPAPRASREDFPLSNVLYCAACGSPMTGGRGGKGQRTYRCAGRCPSGAVVTADRAETYALSIAQDLLTGFEATIGQESDLGELELAEAEARAELEAFASDLTLRRVLGSSYHEHLLEREAAVNEATEAYRTAAKAAEGQRIVYSAADLDDDPEAVGALLRRVAKLVVCRGRGLAIEDRIRVAPLDEDRTAGIASA